MEKTLQEIKSTLDEINFILAEFKSESNNALGLDKAKSKLEDIQFKLEDIEFKLEDIELELK